MLASLHGLGPAPVPAPAPDLWRDTVRIAATHPDPRAVARLRASCDDPGRLDRAAEAWRLAGAGGLAALEEPWTPTRQEAARARTALGAGWDPDERPQFEERGNHWTLTGRDRQLRYGRDGRWYPFARRDGHWHPAGPPHTDPADALAALLDA